MRLLIALLLIGLPLTGCAPANREELAKEILKVDPDFKAVLEKRRQLANDIETFEKELSLTRNTIEGKIAQLKRDLAEAAAKARTKIADKKKRMDPDRERLTVALGSASDELRMKRQQRATLGGQMARLKKAIKAPSLTSEDRARYDQQLAQLQKDAARVDHELAALRQHVRLLKIKLLLIKL